MVYVAEGKGNRTAMFWLSKSKYCNLWQCPKMAWLNKYKPEVKTEAQGVEDVLATGQEIGNLAKALYGDFKEITSMDGDMLDISKMIDDTRHEMFGNANVLCEAAFSFNGLYCAVDILRREGDGWAIYEVKSSTNNSDINEAKPIYVADISYQRYVLEHCGVNVTGTYLVCINNNYIRGEELDINQLFYVMNIDELVNAEIKNVEKNLTIAENIIECEDEPEYDLSERCRDPYECAYWEYCSRHIPKDSVFDLYRMKFAKKIELYRKGLIEYPDLLACDEVDNKTQIRQMEYALNDKGTYIEEENIRDFLRKLSYPLYFLDFETMQPAIPLFPGTKPYQQIPFQYSLHYIEQEGGDLKHTEFLAVSGEDPRRAIAEALCCDIPMNVCVTAYNKAFECTRLKELAGTYPDLAEHLLNIRENIIDLLVPFQCGYYYNRAMGGSFSIKSVLPAIFPDDPELDYHNLEGVHNGSEAMTVFPKIQYMGKEEQKKARHDLLKYCELDTYAMVKVWKELVRVAK